MYRFVIRDFPQQIYRLFILVHTAVKICKIQLVAQYIVGAAYATIYRVGGNVCIPGFFGFVQEHKNVAQLHIRIAHIERVAYLAEIAVALFDDFICFHTILCDVEFPKQFHPHVVVAIPVGVCHRCGSLQQLGADGSIGVA